MELVKSGYSNWYKISGRSSRGEYWGTYAFNLLLAVTSFFVIGEWLYSLVLFISLPIGIGLGIRRMHDAGASGFFLIIPIVNLIYAISKSEQRENKWGPIPEESIEKDSKNNDEEEPPDLIEKKNLSYEEIEDDEIIELEKRVKELEKLIKDKKDDEIQQDKRKKELLDEISKLKEELDE